jgi:prepilin-type N-terminal cleavage/methylation domain-containing protein
MKRSLERAATAGFTLVEMLTVMAIIGMLAALLLPAVQMARDSSRRASCLSNLRQIGTAVHLYHAAQNSFPPGGITIGPCCATESYTSWSIAILPYLELKDVYALYNPRFTNESIENHISSDPNHPPLCQTFVGVYSCPADIQRKTLGVPDSGPARDLNRSYMPGSYRGVGGRSDGESGWWDSTSNPDPNWQRPRKDWKGVFHVVDGKLKCERFETVRDGLTNTLMVGEYCMRPSKQVGLPTGLRRRTFWAYSYGSYNKSDAVAEARTLWSDWDRCSATPGKGDFETCNHSWGSFHTGTVTFLLCDGSVRPVAQTIDMNIFASSATVAGREFAPLP